MEITRIINEIEKAGETAHQKPEDRRGMLKSVGAKVALAALPVALSSLFNKSYGKSTASALLTALNYALELEYLEYTFFRTANNTGGLIPSTDLPGFQTIESQELDHIYFLQNTITTMGGTPFTPNHFTDPTTIGAYVPAAYDFTANGTYPLVFTDYPTFLQLAQVIEDLVVRAYKGQLTVALGTNPLFTQLMELQCTEARHAAHIRLIRRYPPINAPEGPAPWITQNFPPSLAFQAFYNGEDNVQQTGVDITALVDTYNSNAANAGFVPKPSATAAFDEPLDSATVLSLLSPYIKA